MLPAIIISIAIGGVPLVFTLISWVIARKDYSEEQ